MDEHRSRRLQVWTPLLFALVMIFGMTLGFRLRDTLRNKRDIQAVIERNDRLEEVIDLVKERYVDTINANLLYQDAITGILSHLDPHTTYISADQLQDVNEDLEGSFFGIGVEFSIYKDTIQVTSVIENGPAERAGVSIGDQLIKVNDSTVAGIGITSERIIKMLRGKQNSLVNVTIKDGASGKLKHVAIKRDAVPIYSVDAQLMLDASVGYIKINRFAATTFDEFMKALRALERQGMKSLILDLRQNPGGYLQAATKIADQFLADNKMIVYTKGRQAEKEEYKAENAGIFEEGRLVVLIDEGSASASEVLSGAIQDWDRGVIIGRRSFGKGLVQEQYELSDGAALRLTVARYYTPSGRSIQRTFARGRDAYREDYTKRFESGELTGNDTITGPADTMRYYTGRHRVVYGGGGIKPDIYVPYDTSKLGTGLLNMIFSEELRSAVWNYYTAHRPELQQMKNVKDFIQQFQSGKDIVDNYLKTLPANERKQADVILSRTDSRSYIYQQAKAQLARLLFRNNGYYAVSVGDDNVVAKALQVIRGDEYSKIISR